MQVNTATAQLIRESAIRAEAERRRIEKASAHNANVRDYKLTPESLAALERGEQQRATGRVDALLSTSSKFVW